MLDIAVMPFVAVGGEAQEAKEAHRKQMAALSPLARMERALEWGRALKALSEKAREHSVPKANDGSNDLSHS
jgi:hypothetical protein